MPVRVSWTRVPLQLIDIASNGRDAVSVLSQELYHDYLKRGTMALMHLGREGFENVMPFVTFEICAIEPATDEPVWIVAVDRKGEALHLLAWDPEEQQLVSRQEVAVTPPDDEAPYHVPRGFALACPLTGSTERIVQYKRRRFLVLAQGRLKSLPDAPSQPNTAPSP